MNKLITAVIVAAGLVTGAAHATPVTVTWSGTVSESAAAEVSIGDTITGTFTYDSTSPGSAPSAGFSLFETGHDSSFSVNGLSGTLTNNRIGVFNNRDEIADQFDSRSGRNQVYTGDLIGGRSVFNIFVRFNDSSATAITSQDLPTFLDASGFDNLFTSRLDGPGIDFRIDTFSFGETVAPVPLPASLPLALGGIVLLGAVARRRKA